MGGHSGYTRAWTRWSSSTGAAHFSSRSTFCRRRSAAQTRDVPQRLRIPKTTPAKSWKNKSSIEVPKIGLHHLDTTLLSVNTSSGLI